MKSDANSEGRRGQDSGGPPYHDAMLPRARSNWMLVPLLFASLALPAQSQNAADAPKPTNAPGAAPAASPTSAPSAPGAAPAVSPPTTSLPTADAPIPDVRVQRIFPQLALRRPLQVVQAPGDDDRLYILEQAGRVLVANLREPDAKQGELFLDLRERVNDRNNEEGLLSLAFHPNYRTNRRFFVYYTAEKPRRSVLSRFVATEDFSRGDPDSEEVLLEIEQPYWNHNGGTVAFGPDRMLYLGIGDGGAANDPHQVGQDLGSLLGTIIRIDVDREGASTRYAVPNDNPFVGVRGAKPEIWAYGLRNPWRMAFDRATGELWTGDVGQNAWEEIDIIVRGGNYGWNMREGAHAFPGGKPGSFGSEYIEPIVDYPRNEGISVTGGAVWRSVRHPSLNGVYVYGDFGSGRLWGIRHVDGRTSEAKVLMRGGKSKWSSIDLLNDGTLVLTSMEGGERGPGALFVIAPVESVSGAPPVRPASAPGVPSPRVPSEG